MKALVSMLLNGSNVLDQKKNVSQASHTIAQLITFNAKNAFRSKKKKKKKKKGVFSKA